MITCFSTDRFYSRCLGPHCKGSAILEFVLVLPILILPLAVIVDYGWILDQRLAALDTVRTASRGAVAAYSIDCVSRRNLAEILASNYWNRTGNTLLQFVANYVNLGDAQGPFDSFQFIDLLRLEATGKAYCFLCLVPDNVRNIQVSASFRLERNDRANQRDCNRADAEAS